MAFCCDHPGCTKSYPYQRNLQRHQQDHIGIKKRHMCTKGGCGKSYKSKQSLELHIATAHASNKPSFSCDHPGCDKEFRYKPNMFRHARVHTEEGKLPYKCTECPNSFQTKQNLESHSRMHTGSRPYKCEYFGCPAAFKMHHHLSRHNLVHTGERPFACSYPNCGAHFAAKGDMTKHFNCMHTVEGQQRQKKQEERIARALTEAGICYKREQHVDMSCFGGTFARQNFVVDHVPGGIISIEVDEDQHKGMVACELKRVGDIRNALMVSGNTLPWLLIRYNPHAFRVDEDLVSIPKKDREEALVAFIQAHTFQGAPPFQMQYMFYDATRQKGVAELSIWHDAEYLPEYKAACLPPVVKSHQHATIESAC